MEGVSSASSKYFRLEYFEMFSMTRYLQDSTVFTLTSSGIESVGTISARAEVHRRARPGLRFSLNYSLHYGSSLGISACPMKVFKPNGI
jgi:hypothetical protein